LVDSSASQAQSILLLCGDLVDIEWEGIGELDCSVQQEHA